MPVKKHLYVMSKVVAQVQHCHCSTTDINTATTTTTTSCSRSNINNRNNNNNKDSSVLIDCIPVCSLGVCDYCGKDQIITSHLWIVSHLYYFRCLSPFTYFGSQDEAVCSSKIWKTQCKNPKTESTLTWKPKISYCKKLYYIHK